MQIVSAGFRMGTLQNLLIVCEADGQWKPDPETLPQCTGKLPVSFNPSAARSAPLPSELLNPLGGC